MLDGISYSAVCKMFDRDIIARSTGSDTEVLPLKAVLGPVIDANLFVLDRSTSELLRDYVLKHKRIDSLFLPFDKTTIEVHPCRAGDDYAMVFYVSKKLMVNEEHVGPRPFVDSYESIGYTLVDRQLYEDVTISDIWCGNLYLSASGQFANACAFHLYSYSGPEQPIKDRWVFHEGTKHMSERIKKRADDHAKDLIFAISLFSMLNDPELFILEESPIQVPNAVRLGKRAPLKHERPVCTILRPRMIRAKLGLATPDSGSSKTPHERRAHMRWYRDERYSEERRSKPQLIPATWVGPSSAVKGGKKYRVRLDVATQSYAPDPSLMAAEQTPSTLD